MGRRPVLRAIWILDNGNSHQDERLASLPAQFLRSPDTPYFSTVLCRALRPVGWPSQQIGWLVRSRGTGHSERPALDMALFDELLSQHAADLLDPLYQPLLVPCCGRALLSRVALSHPSPAASHGDAGLRGARTCITCAPNLLCGGRARPPGVVCRHPVPTRRVMRGKLVCAAGL